jgi:hypothetical protein
MKYQKTFCSQCGSAFGAGDAGFSSCAEHMNASLAQPDHGFDRTASHMAGEYVDTNWDTSDMAHRAGGLSVEQENEACGYAKRLAQAIWEKYYKEESPDWKPKNDVLGLLTQIDNMTCDLEKSQPEQEPVCTKIEGNQFETFKVRYEDEVKLKDLPVGTKLYTASPSKPWVSLSDEAAIKIVRQLGWGQSDFDVAEILEVVKAIEAKLKEKNNG